MADYSYRWMQEFERKIDLVLNRFELNPGTQPMPEFVRAITALVTQGNKIEAIKVYRTQTGASLDEAKRFVDSLDDNSQIYQRVNYKLDLLLHKLEIRDISRDTASMNPNEAFYGEIKALLRVRNKIEAIRVYREATGSGLKEAKDAVEAIEKELR